MVIYLMKHPLKVNPRDFVSVIRILLHALNTILTFMHIVVLAKSLKNVLSSKINFSPDECTR